MKFFGKTLFTVLLLITATSATAYFLLFKTNFNKPAEKKPFHKNLKNSNGETILRLKQKISIVKNFVRQNNFNSTRCFFIDMKIPSGQKRFFVYNLKKDSVEIAGLVAHGSGSDKGGSDLYFSNSPNSNCTSLGKYKIGKSYRGKFGLSYKLYGLDNSNSKAFERCVVLHAHSCVPDDEVAPSLICESWGCPTVAPAFLKTIKNFIDKSEQPILLWIFY